MPWKLVLIRNKGWKPANGRHCMVCECDLVGEKAWVNKNKHRVKYVCQTCFPKIWVEIPSYQLKLKSSLSHLKNGIYRSIHAIGATFCKSLHAEVEKQ